MPTQPFTYYMGYAGGGVWKTTDRGYHSTKLDSGLPNQLFGRSNIAISDAAPIRIYAHIEAKPGSGNLVTRPFCYTALGVGPRHPDTVWIGNDGAYPDSGLSESAPGPSGEPITRNAALVASFSPSEQFVQKSSIDLPATPLYSSNSSLRLKQQ